MKLKILDRTKKKKIIEGLKPFGVSKINELLIKSGKEKIRAYSGEFSVDEIREVFRLVPVESIGLYIAKEVIGKDGKRNIRPAIEGVFLLKDQIKRRIISLTEEQEKEWFFGRTVELTSKQKMVVVPGEFMIVSAGKDFVGIGKVSEDKEHLFCYLPKERRRKS